MNVTARHCSTLANKKNIYIQRSFPMELNVDFYRRWTKKPHGYSFCFTFAFYLSLSYESSSFLYARHTLPSFALQQTDPISHWHEKKNQIQQTQYVFGMCMHFLCMLLRFLLFINHNARCLFVVFFFEYTFFHFQLIWCTESTQRRK